MLPRDKRRGKGHTMAKQPPSPVPLIPPGQLDCLDLQIEALRDEAEERGLGVLAYLLDCALIEARHQAEQIQRVREARRANPVDLWRPVV